MAYLVGSDPQLALACSGKRVWVLDLPSRSSANTAHAALQAARQRQKTDAFKAVYRTRAGIEGTLSQGVRMGDLRRSRYVGLAKTRLLHLLIAAALNFMRVAASLCFCRACAMPI